MTKLRTQCGVVVELSHSDDTQCVGTINGREFIWEKVPTPEFYEDEYRPLDCPVGDFVWAFCGRNNIRRS